VPTRSESQFRRQRSKPQSSQDGNRSLRVSFGIQAHDRIARRAPNARVARLDEQRQRTVWKNRNRLRHHPARIPRLIPGILALCEGHERSRKFKQRWRSWRIVYAFVPAFSLSVPLLWARLCGFPPSIRIRPNPRPPHSDRPKTCPSPVLGR
jgi:hypothetical protein